MQPINTLLPEESPPEFPAINFRKKQTSYVSNVDGLDPVAYYNRNPWFLLMIINMNAWLAVSSMIKLTIVPQFASQSQASVC